MSKFLFISIFLLFIGCQSNNESKDHEVYTFLAVCYEDYYLNYNVSVSTLLNDFELLLVEEGHLSDTTGQAYKKLFDDLEKTDYFSPPLKMEDFNNTLLYKNPSNIIDCATTIFSLDSMEVMNTNFSKIAEQINQEVMQEKEVSIHYFFNIYKNNLTNDELRMPYIKQSIQLLLYKWYFKSKYDRDIQIKQEDKMESN